MCSVVTHAQRPLQMGRVWNSKQNEGPEAGFSADRQTDLQSCRTKLFSLSSQSNLSFLTELKLSFVQSEWPLTRGLPAQFVSPLIMVILYPTLHIKTHAGSSQTRELGRWAVGKEHSNLYKLCCSKVSFLFLPSRRKRFLPIQMLQKQCL